MGVLEQAQVADQQWRKGVDRDLEEHLERLGRLEDRANESERRMSTMADDLKVNTEATKRIEANTGALVMWVANMTGFKNTIRWLGGLVLWLATIIIAAGVVWWWWHSGELPHK